MIIVDTSVWIDHFLRSNAQLAAELKEGNVLTHPFVIGEIACGNLRNRVEILTSMQALAWAKVASPTEILVFIERHKIMGKGIGYVDTHLLASTLLTKGASLWTRDRKLLEVAGQLNVPRYG